MRMQLGVGRSQIDLGILAAMVMGLAAGIGAIVTTGLDPRAFWVTIAIVLVVTLWLALRSSTRMTVALIAVIAFAFSLNMQITFLPITGVELRRVGGGGGITFTLCSLSAMGLIAMFRIRKATGERNHWLKFQPTLTLAPILFILAGVASTVNAVTPAWIYYEIFRQLMLLIIFIAIMNLETEHFELFLKLFAFSVMLQGLIAIVQTVFDTNLGLTIFGEQKLVSEQIDFAKEIRSTGTIGHPNMLAYFFEITLPLMLALSIVTRGRARAIYLAAFAIGLAGILTTLSRGAWLTLPVTLPLVFGLLHGFKIKSLREALALLVMLMMGVVALYFVGPMIDTRLFADDAGSAGQRLPLDLAAISVIEQYPILGVGLNNFPEAFVHFDRTGFGRWPTPEYHVVHNLYLLVWAEVGTVGFATFLWYFFSAFKVAIQTAAKKVPLCRAVAIGAAAGLLGHMIHGLFDPGFKLSLAISQLIAAQMGLIALAYFSSTSGRRAAGLTSG